VALYQEGQNFTSKEKVLHTPTMTLSPDLKIYAFFVSCFQGCSNLQAVGFHEVEIGFRQF
jgi:hypothetical protein